MTNPSPKAKTLALNAWAASHASPNPNALATRTWAVNPSAVPFPPHKAHPKAESTPFAAVSNGPDITAPNEAGAAAAPLFPTNPMASAVASERMAAAPATAPMAERALWAEEIWA